MLMQTDSTTQQPQALPTGQQSQGELFISACKDTCCDNSLNSHNNNIIIITLKTCPHYMYL